MKNEKKQINSQKKLGQRIVLWGGVIALLGLAVYGLMRLGSGGGPSIAGIANIPSISSKDWTKGSSIARVSLVEYSDLQCPACAAYEPILQQLTKNDASSVLFAYRHFPLPQHKHAIAAASAAEAAGRQGKFWPMHSILFLNQTAWEDASNFEDLFIQYATEINLNVDQFKKDFHSADITQKITADQATGNAAGVDSTPTFFINGKKISPNPVTYDEFKRLIETAL
jgi:protein-disulfide isomerase